MSGWAAKLLVPKKPQTPAESTNGHSLSEAVSSHAEQYNASEVVEALSARYNRDLAAAQQDKQGEKVRVYRSLHATSAWTTPSSAARKNKREEDGRFNLVDEVNRAMARAKKRA